MPGGAGAILDSAYKLLYNSVVSLGHLNRQKDYNRCNS